MGPFSPPLGWKEQALRTVISWLVAWWGEERCTGGVSTERALEQAELLSEMIYSGLLTGTLSKENLSVSCNSACMSSHRWGALRGHREKAHCLQAKLGERFLIVPSQAYHERLKKLKYLSLGNFKKSSLICRKPDKSDGGYPFQKFKSPSTHDEFSLFTQWSMVVTPRSPYSLCVSSDPIYFNCS